MKAAGITLNFYKAYLFHGGAWKKLKDQSVDLKEFDQRVRYVLGNAESVNYYGMA